MRSGVSPLCRAVVVLGDPTSSFTPPGTRLRGHRHLGRVPAPRPVPRWLFDVIDAAAPAARRPERREQPPAPAAVKR